MKIKLFIAVCDGGDGEHPAYVYPSREAAIKNLNLEVEDGALFDEFGGFVEIYEQNIDLFNYEIIG